MSPAIKTLTPKQKAVFDYIRDYLAKEGVSPTYQEIQDYFQLKSVRSVQQFLLSLAQKGLIRLGSSNEKRAIKLAPSQLLREPLVQLGKLTYDELCRARSLLPSLVGASESTSLPLLGLVAAGNPIEAIENEESVDVPRTMTTRGENFVLRVTGDSMKDEGILDGDHIIVRRQATARNGEIVIATIDGEATVKKFQQTDQKITLYPANADFKPIVVKQTQAFRIVGIVVGLIRHFK